MGDRIDPAGRAPVVIVDYDPTWPARFEAGRSAILDAIGEYAVATEHMGSTAVPGLAAKPIIDIMVLVRDLGDAPACVPRLASLGYDYVPEFEAEMPERRYFRKGPPSGRTHHLHMYAAGEDHWRRYLLFRDYLRAHPEAARQYADLKRGLAERFGSDREGYTDAKTAFVRAIEAKARVWRGETTLTPNPSRAAAGEGCSGQP